MKIDGDRLTPVGRFLRNLGEKLAKRFYEGPEPPERIARYAEEFAILHPGATRAEWVRFATGLGQTFYRSGWTRGFEWTDRDLDRRDPLVDPDRLAHAMGHDWEWGGGGPVGAPDDVVPEERSRS